MRSAPFTQNRYANSDRSTLRQSTPIPAPESDAIGARARPPTSSSAARSAGTATSRTDELSRLLPLWPHEIEDTSPRGRARVLAILERALRAERRRAIAGHRAYDLARHAALLSLYREEVAAARRGKAAVNPGADEKR